MLQKDLTSTVELGFFDTNSQITNSISSSSWTTWLLKNVIVSFILRIWHILAIKFYQKKLYEHSLFEWEKDIEDVKKLHEKPGEKKKKKVYVIFQRDILIDFALFILFNGLPLVR